MIADGGWQTVQLSDAIVAKYGKALPSANRQAGAVPVYGSNGIVGQHDVALSGGPTIVIGRKGSSGAVNFSPVPCWPIDTTYYIDEPGPYSIGFLARLLQTLGLTELDRSTAIPGLNREQLYAISVPVPPIGEQDAIVNVLGGVETSAVLASDQLSVARTALERFRQATLAAACTGRLTSDWRDLHPRSEPASSVLDELRANRAPRRQREQPVDLAMPETPESYATATLGECAVKLEYGTSKKCVSDPAAGLTILRMGNIQGGQLDFDDLKYCPVDNEITRLTLESGDLLFNRTNSPELVGKSAVYRSSVPASFASYLIRVRFDERVALPEFVNFWLNSAWGRSWAQMAKTDGVSQSNINGSKLALMPVPLPPVDEQLLIVERASQMLSIADGLLQRVDLASRTVDRATMAVLAKAFRGGLLVSATEARS